MIGTKTEWSKIHNIKIHKFLCLILVKGWEMIFSLKKIHWPLSNIINLKISKQSIVYQISNSCYVEVLHWKPPHLNMWKLYKRIRKSVLCVLNEVTVTEPLVYRFLRSIRSKLNWTYYSLNVTKKRGVTRSLRFLGQ